MRTSATFFGLAFSLFPFAFCLDAQAQFNGHFSPENWTVSNNSDASAEWSAAQGTLIINGGNDGSGLFGFIDVTIASNVTGNVSFNWSYNNSDPSGLDEALYIDDAIYFPLSNTSNSSGFVSFSINAGEIIGFSIETEDNLGGRGELTITNFSAVPEPTAMAMVGTVLGVLGLRRRRVVA